MAPVQKWPRLLVRSLLPTRPIYQAQFQHVNLAKWARIEAISRAAMRTITCLATITPIPAPHAGGQGNTLDELVYQRRSTRMYQLTFVAEAAALGNCRDRSLPKCQTCAIFRAPWPYHQVTYKRPLSDCTIYPADIVTGFSRSHNNWRLSLNLTWCRHLWTLGPKKT